MNMMLWRICPARKPTTIPIYGLPLAAATQRGIAVELRRVSEPVIHQLNMIVATRAHTRSFYGPYACDRCGREESMLIDVDVNGSTLAQLQPPPMTCPMRKAPIAGLTWGGSLSL